MAGSRVFREYNTLLIQGSFGLQDLHLLLAKLHQAVQVAGFPDVVLDFSKCEAAFPSSMLALCAQVAKRRRQQIEVSLILPSEDDLRRLFLNANWAHFLSPEEHGPSTFRGYTQVPATLYTSDDEQHKAVNRIVNAILGAIPEIARKDFAALDGRLTS
jgi:hypothetical protein